MKTVAPLVKRIEEMEKHVVQQLGQTWSEKKKKTKPLTEKKSLQTLKSVKKEGEEVLHVPEKRFPINPWRRPWEEGCSTVDVEKQAGADIITAAHEGPHARASRYSLKEDVSRGRPVLEQASRRNSGP